MTFEFYGWIIEYYVFSISPGHGNSGRGRPESRGNAFKKVNNPVTDTQVCNKPALRDDAAPACVSRGREPHDPTTRRGGFSWFAGHCVVA